MNCKICEKPSGMYPLCQACFKLRDAGKIVKCEECGEWHYTNKPCRCTKPVAKTVVEEPPKETLGTELTCIICGEPSNGKHFCLKCYRKYHERTITIEIKECKEATIVDAYGNKDTKTANGLYVRSLSEKIIYDELFKRGIKCEYERTVTYKDENGEIKELHPDFYLTDYKLYIEHWGYLDSRDAQYEKEKIYKEKIYKSKGYRLAATTSKDIKDIQSAIERLLLENDIDV
ncbi:MAG: hypothetical protein E7612_08095 [Ruminococcaceae bacterium]|nr:hypothetical protein [Oscillospiraceae bacterium]